MIYIAGTSHSGSTLLELMLNAHPDVISVGELAKLKQQLRTDDERQSAGLRRYVGSHHPGDGGFVGDGQRGIPQLTRAVDQFLMGSSELPR